MITAKNLYYTITTITITGAATDTTARLGDKRNKQKSLKIVFYLLIEWKNK